MQHRTVRIPRNEDPGEYLAKMWAMVGPSTSYVYASSKYEGILKDLDIPARINDVQGDAEVVFVALGPAEEPDNPLEGVRNLEWDDVMQPRGLT